MTSIEQFLREKVSRDENYCCEEEPLQTHQNELHYRVPALLRSAPYWSGVAIVDLKRKNISLKDYRGKYLVLFFYPYDFTFICPTEMIQFNDRIDEFQKLGCEVVAISTDSEFSHLAWILTPRKQGGLGDMKIAVLSDKNHEISKKYGVLDEKEGISLKGLFVIDKNQLIRHFSFSEISLSRSVDETLRLLQACQFIDTFGEACPAGPREKLYSSDGPNYFSVT